MKGLRRVWWRMLGAISGSCRDRELEDELAFHIEMQTEDNRRAGMDPVEARRAARLKFGGVDAMTASYRAQRGLPMIEGIVADLRHAWRGLLKSRAFTAVAVLTLALGIGAITAIFSLVDQILLRPPGIQNPERVLTVLTAFDRLKLDVPVSSAQVLTDLRDARQVFEHAALMKRADVNYTGGVDPQRLRGAFVTAEWFDVFAVQPQMGRVFHGEEDQPNANRVVVLSYAAWTQVFGADRSILGRSVELNQIPHRVVGVMPPDFRWPQSVDLWMPAGLRADMFSPRMRFQNIEFVAVARTRPDVSFAQAQEWLRLLTEGVRNGGGPAGVAARDYGWRLSAVLFVELVAGETRTPLLVLSGAVMVVLIIVCANVAGRLLARASVRAREFSVRAALGAGRRQLLRALFVESLLLAVMGGAAGMALAGIGVKLLLMLAPPEAVAGLQPRMDLRVWLFCAGVAMASSLLFGLAPAWHVSRVDPGSVLNGDNRSATPGHGRQRLRSVLVVVETALALILLVTGGLFLRSYFLLQQVHPGFNAHGVMTAAFWLPQQAYPGDSQKVTFYRTLLGRLGNTPGITAAALGVPMPFSGATDSDIFRIEGRLEAVGEPQPYGDVLDVTPQYFETLGIPLKRGRYFSDQDGPGVEHVVVIDENLAKQYFRNEEPIGQRIFFKSEFYRIVGIAGHVANSNLAVDNGRGALYFNVLQRPVPVAWVLAKTNGEAVAAVGAIRNAIREADPKQAVHSFLSMDDAVSNSMAPRRFAMQLLTFFGAVALLLSALGLYGVISYSVTQRTRELGVHIALGAEPARVLRLVVRQGLRLAAIGAALGLFGSLAGARMIQSQLFEVSPFDPFTIAGMALMLLSVAGLASYLPARRAMRVDPVVALRAD